MKRAKSIMVMGTMSSSGKSFVTAGLCRIFHQDGFRTAPFKSQNMALNSYITKDGYEMGRAQVMQAEAAGIAPDVRMNPILLKPTSECGSQVIVNGEVLDTMRATEYYRRKQEMIPQIVRAYDSLALKMPSLCWRARQSGGNQSEIRGYCQHGHGKPLRLSGNSGGRYRPWWRICLSVWHSCPAGTGGAPANQGIVINKFRGDVSILESGLRMLENLTGIPVLGVLPYAPIDLDEEDSLAERLTQHGKKQGAALDIAVIRLPHISNFTDFDIFDSVEAVSLRYVTHPAELGTPDWVILPGTKSTMADLRWMRQNGMEAKLLKLHEKGCLITGICGGFQMLGKTITDPHQAEGGGSMRGIGLLAMDTVFSTQKQRRQIQGQVCQLPESLRTLSGAAAAGYEIHMGQSTSQGVDVPLLRLDNGETDGLCTKDGQVFGTYLHGVFDAPEFLQPILQMLLQKNGNAEITAQPVDRAAYKETQYNRLAELLREHLDIPKIYDILNQWESAS
ncbi:MAG: cobyric acid synthase [Ruminococcus sp.]